MGLREAFSFIIFAVALVLSACFITVKFYLVTIALIILNMAIVTAQFIDYAEFSSNAHGLWIAVYILFILFFRALEDSPLVGLLDNNVTRRFYRPSVEEREQAVFHISLACWVIVAASYLAYLALDQCLVIGQEAELVADVEEAKEENEPEVESVEADEEEGPKPLNSVLKEMFDDAKKMMTKTIEFSGVKKAFETVNAMYKKTIGEPIVHKVNEESKGSAEFQAMIQVVRKHLKDLNNSYKKTIAEPIYKCTV